MKLALVFVIAIFLLQAAVQASLLSNAENSLASRDVESNAIATAGKHPKKINCKFACARRCRKSSRKNVPMGTTVHALAMLASKPMNSRALVSVAMGLHLGVARADISVSCWAGWYTAVVTPLAACVAGFEAHLLLP
ncbi:hypothetical protein SLA2020_316250 [Shorea laevis]